MENKENKTNPTITLEDYSEFNIWGNELVFTYSIDKFYTTIGYFEAILN